MEEEKKDYNPMFQPCPYMMQNSCMEYPNSRYPYVEDEDVNKEKTSTTQEKAKDINDQDVYDNIGSRHSHHHHHSHSHSHHHSPCYGYYPYTYCPYMPKHSSKCFSAMREEEEEVPVIAPGHGGGGHYGNYGHGGGHYDYGHFGHGYTGYYSPSYYYGGNYIGEPSYSKPYYPYYPWYFNYPTPY